MAELITEDQPRIKFQSTREGELSPPSCSELADLAELMVELEQAGVIPVLNDGLAAGNCAMRAELCQPSCGPAGSGGTGERDPGGCGAASRPPPIYVSRSGKPPGVAMAAADWVLVTRFDAAAWSASYRSAGLEARPTSDAPLHWGSLVDGACAEYGWGEAPRVAVHGHALAEGPGLELAEALGLPISHEATMFSTPEDFKELRSLYAAHPYPQHRCYIRRGHGFFLLGRSVEDCRCSFRTLIAPHLARLRAV